MLSYHLLVWGDALLVLDLGLDVLDRVRALHLQGDGLARERLDEDLHVGGEAKALVEGEGGVCVTWQQDVLVM